MLLVRAMAPPNAPTHGWYKVEFLEIEERITTYLGRGPGRGAGWGGLVSRGSPRPQKAGFSPPHPGWVFSSVEVPRTPRTLPISSAMISSPKELDDCIHNGD